VKNNASEQIMDIITLVQAAKSERVLHNREELSAIVPAEAVRVFHRDTPLAENVRSLGPRLHRS